MGFIPRDELARQLAETYAGGRVADPWTQVTEYREYVKYKAQNPNAGRTKIGNAIEVPPSRVRSWNNGAKPDAQKAIEVAEKQNWLDATVENEQFRVVTALLAWIFSSGSIKQDGYDPYFVVSKEIRSCLLSLLDIAGHTQVRENRVDATNRASEIIPSENATILGRFLVALGAPLGTKANITALTLPDWLTDAPLGIRENFLRVYMWNRGTERPDRPQTPIQISEKRSRRYRFQLRELVNSVVADGMRGDSQTYRLSATAASRLYRPPECCGDPTTGDIEE